METTAFVLFFENLGFCIISILLLAMMILYFLLSKEGLWV